MKKTFGVIIGCVLIAYGIICALSALGIANFDFSFEGWWTLFIIIPCFIGIINGKEIIFNIAGILIGVVLLLSAQGLFSYGTAGQLFVPIILIATGAKIIEKSLTGKNDKEDAQNDSKNNNLG